MRFNSVTIAPVRSLEPGDLIAKEFLGGVISGKVTGLVYAAYQLTAEQRRYMESREYMKIPENEYEPIAGVNSVLMFGSFRGEGINHDQPGHMFVNCDVNVAVFPVREK